ncbi:hypothetical protein B566_EDAN004865 [Ephemera danica]|nr:hypothetical protein B566_EDAN004865 [Ephemera danica]
MMFFFSMGDVGGPLQMIDNDGGWTLIGTLTYTVPNQCSLYPSVYTRITSCLRWIANVAGINLRP